MRLRKIHGVARGQDLQVDFGDVSLIAGPTGSFKTTALNLIHFAVDGHVRGRGRQIRRLTDVYRELGGEDGGEVAAVAYFEDETSADRTARHFIRRRITSRIGTDGQASLRQEADESGLNEGVGKRVGNLGNLDIRALLDETGPNRVRAILDMCQPFDDGSRDAAWCADRFRAITGHDPTDWVDRPGTFAALQATAEASRQAVLTHRRSRDAAQQALDRLAERAAQPPTMPGGVEELGRALELLDREIGEIQRSLGDPSAERQRAISTQIRDLDRLRPPATVKHELRSAQERLAQAEAARAALAPPPAPTADSLTISQGAEADALAAHEAARDEAVAAQLRRDAAREAVASVGGTCPTCHQTITAEHLAALKMQVAHLDAAATAAEAAARRSAQTYESIRGIVAEAKRNTAEARVRHADSMAAYMVRRAELDAQIERERSAIAALEVEQRTIERAGEKRLKLEAELAGIDPIDITTLQVRLQGATQRRADIRAARDVAVAQREARESMAAAAATRDAAVAAIEPAKVSRDAWQQIRAEYTRGMIAPFTDACRCALPEGWTIDFDLEAAAFTVSRPDRPTVDLLSLSEGERVVALSACAVGMARTAGNPWRLCVVDHAEALSNWPTAGAPDGLFARFMVGLRQAIDDGLIDQAIVAYSRIPTPAETAHCDVVHLTAPIPEAAIAPAVAPPATEPLTDEALDAFIERLPDRSKRFLLTVRDRRSITITDAMAELGIDPKLGKVMGGILGSIARWSKDAGIRSPVEVTSSAGERVYRWRGR